MFVCGFIKLNLMQKKGKQKQENARSIGMSFVQVISLLNSFPVAWPQLFLTMFQVGGAVTVLGQHLVNLKCMYPDLSEADVFWRYVQFIVFVFLCSLHKFQLTFAFFNVLLFLFTISTRLMWSVLPLLLPLLSVVFWYTFHFFKPTELQLLHQNIKVTVVCVLYIIWPGLCGETMQMFACRTICGNELLIVDLEEECWTGRHAMYAGALGLPMLFLYVVGFPTVVFVLMKRMRRRSRMKGIDIDEMKGNFHLSRFYTMFRPGVWWWEGTVAIRKILIVVIGVFGTSMGGMQVHFTAFLMVVVMVITAKVRPYGDKRELMLLEMFSLFMIWMTLWGATVFNSYPRCEDPISMDGGTMPWCDAMSVAIGIGDVCVILSVIGFMIYFKKKKLVKLLKKRKEKQARKKALRLSQTHNEQKDLRERMQNSCTIDNPANLIELTALSASAPAAPLAPPGRLPPPPLLPMHPLPPHLPPPPPLFSNPMKRRGVKTNM